jgi:NAD(P)-dependent dehydrogenase (short-subunit alcohol dehydrogenase family)
LKQTSECYRRSSIVTLACPPRTGRGDDISFSHETLHCAGAGKAFKTASRDKATGAIQHFPIADFDRIIQINLVGTFRCIAKSAAGMMTLPALQDGERGAIVTTASVAAQDGQIGQASYSASKAAIVGMTLPIARDLMGEGIRINTILPGIFDTPMLAGLPDKVRDALAASVPFPKRLGDPNEYAALAEFMVTTGYLIPRLLFHFFL